MAQQYKINKVQDLKEFFEKNPNYIFTDYRGLNVESITEIRKNLAKSGAKFIVIKNTFIDLIAKEKGIDDLKENTIGPTAVAFTNADGVAEVAKYLINFTKESSLKVKGGWVDGALLDAKAIEALSKLPSKAQLIAMMMSTMNAPIQNFVAASNDVIARFVRVLNAVADKKKEA